MHKLQLLVASVVTIVCLSAPLLAQDTGIPDTVYYGDNGKAYGYSGGVFRVPVYVTSDQSLQGICLGMEFGLNTSGLVFDSLSKLGSIFWNNQYFDVSNHFLMTNLLGCNPPNPDTVGFGGASNSRPLPAGRYKLCDVFFHGASIGDQIAADSAWFPQAGNFIFVPYSQGAWNDYVPRFVGGSLTIAQGTPEFFSTLPAQINGIGGNVVTFSFGAEGTFPPVTIALDSLRKVSSGALPFSAPVCATGNPVTFNWSSLYYEVGTWTAFFTATDGAMHTQQLTTSILMSPGANYGDANCDGVIDISDVVYLIGFIFTPGSPAPCTQ